MNSKINFIIFLILSCTATQAANFETEIFCNTSAELVVNNNMDNPCDIVPTFVGLPAFADPSTGPISLTGIPAGGVFSGNGVLFNAFNPILAGPGIHEVTYTYNDPATDCVSATTQTILVFTVIDNWVVYQIGFISPRLGITSDILTEQMGDYDLRITDLNGRIVHQTNVTFTKGFQLETLNEIDLPYGLYVATLQNKEHTFSKQLILGR